jgi:hypothetical protein
MFMYAKSVTSFLSHVSSSFHSLQFLAQTLRKTESDSPVVSLLIYLTNSAGKYIVNIVNVYT